MEVSMQIMEVKVLYNLMTKFSTVHLQKNSTVIIYRKRAW
jgi:hypothetical protein